MSLLNYFKRKSLQSASVSASVAKDRLQIILAREHGNRNEPDYLPKLKQELLAVVSKYVNVDISAISVTRDRDGDCEILELNITLPEPEVTK